MRECRGELFGKSSPLHPLQKLSHKKKKKDNSKDADRRIERAIKMIYVGDDVPKTKVFLHLRALKMQESKKALIFLLSTCIIKTARTKGENALKLTIREDPNINETEVSVVCPKMTAEVEEIVANIGLIGQTIAGKREGATFFIPATDIFYFESVDGNTFFYTEGETYEATARLYKIEESLQNLKFARVSKTVIANLRKMRCIMPAQNSRLVATLINDEKIVVSRQYVSEIKKKLGV